jgi:hypothetical protein
MAAIPTAFRVTATNTADLVENFDLSGTSQWMSDIRLCERRARDNVLLHRVIHLIQLDTPASPSPRRPGSTFAVGTGFRRCSGTGLGNGTSLPDASCE